MKKITLALFSVVCFFGSVLSQPNITIQAPSANSSSQLRAPNGTGSMASLKACYLIKKTELTALTGTLVTGFALDLLAGTGSLSCSGQFTVYLQNTADAIYNKGTSFSSALVGMTQCFSGNITVPSSTSPAQITIGCTPNFTYTPAQGGIYVAYVWQSSGPYSPDTYPATYNANYISGGGLGAASSDSVIPAPNTMTVNDFRPAFLITAVNQATNEAGVLTAIAPGKVTNIDGGQTVNATIKNSSIGSLSNIAVTMNVTGANTYNNVQTISSLAAGATTVVQFTAFNPTTNGLNTMSISIAADQNLNNNSMVWTQSVSCTDVAIHPPYTAGSYTSQGYGAGASTNGLIYAIKYTPGIAGASVTAVKLVIPSFASASNLSKQIFAVLLDASGTLIGQGNQVTITAAMMDVFSSVSYTAPIALTAGTDYYIGIATTANGYFPVGITPFANYALSGYVSAPFGGGALTQLAYGDFSLEGVMSYSQTAIHASPSKTVVCKKDGPNTVTLTATGNGSNTFTWTPGGTGASIAVTPTVAGASTATGVVFYSVIGTETVSGCKSSAVTITVAVSLCTGLATNTSNGYDLKLFPNPAVNGKSTIIGLVGTNSIVVLNTLGQVVLTKVATEESTSIDLSNFPSGNYLVKITGDDSESRLIKVVNQN